MEKNISNDFNKLLDSMKLSKKQSEMIKGGATIKEFDKTAMNTTDQAAICFKDKCNPACNTSCTECITICILRCFAGTCVSAGPW